MSSATGPSDLAVEIVGVSRRFGDVMALDGVSLGVCRGEFLSLLGPSGCGKTTLLRILAGLECEDAGEVRIGGRPMRGVPAHRRPVNTVFQSYALFPHLDVGGNVAFGLRMKGVAAAERDRRVGAVMGLVEIGELSGRRPAELSGGQKQRVALARAIVNEPEVLLLDEPMAALDLKRRKQLQGELRRLQQRLGMTFVYVTHDQEEALVMSDRIAVMRAGRIEQMGVPRDLYERPRTRFAAEFLGRCSLIEGRVCGGSAVGAQGGVGFGVATPLGELRVAGEPPPGRGSVTLAIRPERVRWRVGDVASGLAENEVRARVTGVVYAGAGTQHDLEVGGRVLKVESLNGSDGAGAGAGAGVGADVVVQLPAGSLVVLDD